jgi:hypothetical protein
VAKKRKAGIGKQKLENGRKKKDFSLRRPTLSQERKRKKKSACSVRNDGGGLRSGLGGFLEFEVGGVGEEEKEKLETRRQKVERRRQKVKSRMAT